MSRSQIEVEVVEVDRLVVVEQLRFFTSETEKLRNLKIEQNHVKINSLSRDQLVTSLSETSEWRVRATRREKTSEKAFCSRTRPSTSVRRSKTLPSVRTAMFAHASTGERTCACRALSPRSCRAPTSLRVNAASLSMPKNARGLQVVTS